MGNKVNPPILPEAEAKKAGTSHHFKVLLVGSAGVGKTAIFQRFIHNKYQPPYPTRMIVNIAAKVYELKNDVVTIELWDVPSFGRSDAKPASPLSHNPQLLLDEFESSLKHLYLKQVDGVVVIADVGRLPTFHQVKRWKILLADYFEQLGASSGASSPDGDLDAQDHHPRRLEELPIILLANKRDLKQTDIFLRDIKDVAEKEQLRGGFLGSALEDEDIDSAFAFLVQEMLKQRAASVQLRPAGSPTHSHSDIPFSARGQAPEEEQSSSDDSDAPSVRF